MRPGGGSVGLGKGFKNGLLFFKPDADAGVRYGETQMAFAVLRRGVHDRDPHLAAVREFNRVVGEIDQDLLKRAKDRRSTDRARLWRYQPEAEGLSGWPGCPTA